MNFTVEMIIHKKHKSVVSQIKHLILFAVIVGVLALMGMTIGFKVLDDAKIVLVIFIFLGFVMATKILKYKDGYRKVTMYVDNTTTVRTVYRGNQYIFNMVAEYNRNNLSVTHYTYSNTIGIITSISGYEVEITGDKHVLKILLPIIEMCGIRVSSIDDRPDDNDD